MGTIAKITVDGSTHLLASTAYAICSTEANIAEKTAVIQENNEFILFTGVTVHIKFTASNSADVPTLNINGTGAYPIKQYGTTSVGNTEDTSWKAGATLSVTFDGNYWQLNGASSTGSEYTSEEKTKLAGIESGAEVNVQSDWNENDTTSDAYIQNKPTIPAAVQPTTTAPKMDGIAAIGTETKYARGDHVHPSDTTRVPTTRTINGKALSSDITIDATEIKGYTDAQTHQDVSVSSWIQNIHQEVEDKVEDVKVNGVSVVNSSRKALINLTADKIEFQPGGSSTIPHWEDVQTVDVALDMLGQAFPANDFTDAYKTKLDGIESGAEVNVNADWNATSGDAQILNKPEIPNSQTMQGYVNSVYEDLADLYESKSSVSWSQLVSSGVQIASINIDGNTVQVFAPTSGGGSSYTPTIRINGSDYSILRWEKTVLNNISGINFVYQDGSLESTAFVPDSEGISYIINQIPTQPSDIGALSSANLDMEMDSVDLKQLDIYFSTEGGSGHPSTSSNMIETTWANLKTLRDNSQLVKGAWYRITDYNFITTRLGLQSGNHQFDIVLLAISESMLSESGYACRHAGDHYFEREVTEGGIEWLYTLYVDDYAKNYGDEAVDHSDDIHSVDAFCASAVLPHPDTGNDVPVLYKTNTEEYDISEPDYGDAYFYEGTYDLDGDEYDMWSKYEPDPDTGDLVFMQQYALTPIVVEDGELIVSPIPETKLVPVNMNAWELKYCLDNDKGLFDWASTDGKGVIYYLKDEFGNEAPYDFKNAMFQRKNITSVSSNILSTFTQGEYSRLGLQGNHAVTTGNNNYYYYTFDTPYNAGNDSSLFGESAYNVIKPYIMDGQRIINNIVLGFANNNSIGNNCFDLTLWGTVRDNTLKYNCSNLLMVGLTQSTMTYVRSSTFFSLGATTFGNGCSQNIGSMFTNSDIGDSCNNNNFGTGNMGIKTGSGCTNNTFGTYNYNNTFDNGVSNCTFGNYCSYNKFETSAQSITLPNYVRYCKFELGVSRITFTTSGGSNSSYIQYITIRRGISNLSIAPSRGAAYEQIYYKNGRIETAV